MPLNVVCGACGKQFTVPDHYAGRTGACTQCGKPVVAAAAPVASVAMTASSEAAFAASGSGRVGAVALTAPPASAPPASAPPASAPPASAPPVQGQVSIGNALGGYRLTKKLGDAKSSVFLGESAKGNVALKVLPDKVTAQFPTAAKRFLREARSLFGLTHDNVVTVLDAGEELGCLYLAMELFDGRTARELLDQQRKVPPAQAISIALGVARALAHLDAHKLVHRNVKPEHILVAADGHVKLCGLGLVKSAEADSPLTVRGHIVGTPQYLSPEQAEGAEELDIRADLWGLGVTLFELLTGAPPWTDRNPMKVLQLIATAPLPPLPPDVHPALAMVVAKLLAKDLSARYRTPDLLAKDLAAIEEGALVGGKPPSFLPRTDGLAAPTAPAAVAPADASVKRLTLMVGVLFAVVVLLIVVVLILVARG